MHDYTSLAFDALPVICRLLYGKFFRHVNKYPVPKGTQECGWCKCEFIIIYPKKLTSI